VPFYLRSGKRLATKATEISLQFKRVPHLIFPENAGLTPKYPHVLHYSPTRVCHLRFETKVAGAGMRAEPVDMAFHFSDHFGQQALPEAYERLLLDAMQGDASLFARSDEIELAWRLVDPLTVDAKPVFYGARELGPGCGRRVAGRGRPRVASRMCLCPLGFLSFRSPLVGTGDEVDPGRGSLSCQFTGGCSLAIS